jgi:hypothetical protein
VALLHGISQGGLDENDRTYLAQVVSARTGLPPDQADRRVALVETQSRDAIRQGRQHGDESRCVFLVLVVYGAFVRGSSGKWLLKTAKALAVSKIGPAIHAAFTQGRGLQFIFASRAGWRPRGRENVRQFVEARAALSRTMWLLGTLPTLVVLAARLRNAVQRFCCFRQ